MLSETIPRAKLAKGRMRRKIILLQLWSKVWMGTSLPKWLLIQPGMRESVEEIVTLQYISKSTFLLLLKCIYTGEIQTENTQVLEFFLAADMFDLPNLRKTCLEAARLKIKTVELVQFLKQAHACCCDDLKWVAVQRIRKSFAMLSQTPEMKELSTRPLLLEIVEGHELKIP